MGASSEPSGRKIPLARPDIGTRELELVTQVLDGDVLAMGPFTVASRPGSPRSSVGARLSPAPAGLPDCTWASARWGSAMATRSSRRRSASSPRPTACSTSAPSHGSSTSRTRALASIPTLVEEAGTTGRGDPARPRVRSTLPDRAPWIDRPAPRLGDHRGRLRRARLIARRAPLGSFGDVAVFAFYPNKQITTGEGGMVVTDDPALAETMRSLREPGARHRRDLAPARTSRLQLSAR